jgi:hypothetical protein
MKSWLVSKLLVSEAGASRLQLQHLAAAFRGGGVFKKEMEAYATFCEVLLTLDVRKGFISDIQSLEPLMSDMCR